MANWKCSTPADVRSKLNDKEWLLKQSNSLSLTGIARSLNCSFTAVRTAFRRHGIISKFQQKKYDPHNWIARPCPACGAEVHVTIARAEGGRGELEYTGKRPLN